VGYFSARFLALVPVGHHCARFRAPFTWPEVAIANLALLFSYAPANGIILFRLTNIASIGASTEAEVMHCSPPFALMLVSWTAVGALAGFDEKEERISTWKNHAPLNS
jgi:hypothetical protein